MNKDKKLQEENISETSYNFSRTELLPLDKKTVTLSYSGEDISTDGGSLLLKEVDNQIGMINSLVSCMIDSRDDRYVTHSLSEMISQRVFQIACGYEDANDCDWLKQDPIFKICSGVLPESGHGLASQPTMSRLENTVSRTVLYRMAICFAQQFVDSYAKEPPVIIIDCDDTNNNAHGEQLEIEFNNYYKEYCFMPLHIYEGLSGKLITTILKPGRRSKTAEVSSILKRIIKFLREHWKNTVIVVRGDSHFCSHEFMDWASAQEGVRFATGITGNSVLNRKAAHVIETSEESFKRTGKPVKRYHTFTYKAGSWEIPQRIITKVEVNEKGTNVRYIATDLWEYRTKGLYETLYCKRGNAELYIKEHKVHLKSSRTSCHRFEANQFRMFLHSAAYVLIHAMQKNVLKGSEYYNSTMKTIQLKILKTAAYVKEMKTKIKIEFPKSCPVKREQLKAFRIFEVLRC